MGLIVDSTAFIHAERAGSSVVEVLLALQKRFGDREIAISVMSAYELAHGIWRAATPRIRARREAFVEEILIRVPTRAATLTIARIAAQIDARSRSQGLTIPTSDLFIGATALDLGFAVVTGNLRHFRKIPDLDVLEFN